MRVVEPMCRLIERTPADAYVIACASDPGIEAARASTPRPVFGVFRCAVAAAAARAERFGVVAIVDASKARHMAALRAMGLAERLAGEVALNVAMEDAAGPGGGPGAARSRQRGPWRRSGPARWCWAAPGWRITGRRCEAACGVPVIEPCQAGAVQALLAVGGGAAGG